MSYADRLNEILYTCIKCKKPVTRNDKKGLIRITDVRICPHCGHRESIMKKLTAVWTEEPFNLPGEK